jgi:hypothetical protein
MVRNKIKREGSPGESYSDVILRLAKGDAAGMTRRPHPYFYLFHGVASAATLVELTRAG